MLRSLWFKVQQIFPSNVCANNILNNTVKNQIKTFGSGIQVK